MFSFQNNISKCVFLKHVSLLYRDKFNQTVKCIHMVYNLHWHVFYECIIYWYNYPILESVSLHRLRKSYASKKAYREGLQVFNSFSIGQPHPVYPSADNTACGDICRLPEDRKT